MHSTAKRNSPILALPGFLASAFAIIIGCLALLTSIPSLGRQTEYGYLLSPAAGGFLFILLGLAGALGSSLYLESRRATRALAAFAILLALPGLLAMAVFREWAACLLLIIIAAATLYAAKTKKSAFLLLFAGFAGFPIGQWAIITLPYGWKTWAIPGVLFVFAGLIIAFRGDLSRLPHLIGRSGNAGPASRFLYTFFSLVLIILSMAALIHIPADTGRGLAGTAGFLSPGLMNEAANSWNPNGTEEAEEAVLLNNCDCENVSLANTSSKPFEQSCQEDVLRAKIISPEDVQTFPRGETVLFRAQACGEGPFQYLWWSNLDGIIESRESFQSRNLTPGWHTITLDVTDSHGSSASASIELGIAPQMVCGKVNPRPKYYPVDTPCQDIWPNGTAQCQQIEVCHPDLDYIVVDAVRCCNGTAKPGSACAWALANSGGDKKKCRGLYIIRAFGPDAVYMQGYALFKACCSGYPECTRTSWPSLAGTCSFREGFNQNVQNISCRPEEWGVSAWHSDTNMSMNSAVLGLFPTHATVNILRTGVCIDYAAALTTALRKAGYNRTEALTTSSMGYDLPLLGDHPGHAYNLVKLPGDDLYHIVDTTGNGEGINLGGLPHYFRFTGNFMGQPVKVRVFDWWVGYCSKISPNSFNDAGYTRTPENSSICGCAG
jgi:hypothetical protein